MVAVRPARVCNKGDVLVEAGMGAQVGAVLRKTRSFLQTHRFQKDFRGEMLKRHVTLIHFAEGVQALRADDLPRAVRPGGATFTGRQVQECPCRGELVFAEATGDVPG